MYKKPHYTQSLIFRKDATREGETIEMKVLRLVENKEPIKDGAPVIYTEKSAGVNPAYNIRTDRFEIATEMMDKVNKSKEAKAEDLIKLPEAKEIKMDFGKAEPTADTAKK